MSDLTFEEERAQEQARHEAELRAKWGLDENFVGRVPNVDKMFTFLKGFFTGVSMPQALKALGDMRKAHAGQKREGGLPYIVHPLSMTCAAVEFWKGPKDDVLDDIFFAALLLHDVEEDTYFSLKGAGYSEEVCRTVECVTLSKHKNETKYEMKKRKTNGLLTCQRAALIKMFDCDYNLTTMVGIFDEVRIRKNVVEADLLRMPVFKQAKDQWSGAGNLFSALRRSIRGKLDILAILYKVKLTEGDFINAPDAVDYSCLLTDAT